MMNLLTTIIFFVLLCASNLSANNSSEELTLNITSPIHTIWSNFSVEENITLPVSQEPISLNITPNILTSLVNNALTFQPNESLLALPTNSITPDDHLVTNVAPRDNFLNLNVTEAHSIPEWTTLSDLKPTEMSTNVLDLEVTTKEQGLSSTKNPLQMILLTSLPSLFAENATTLEEAVEQNAILSTDPIDSTEKNTDIVVGRKCTRLFQDSILWNDTDGGILALKSCPSGYQGNMYRPCFTNGKWGNVDYTECRLEHLGRMRHMIFHQVQKGMLGNMYLLVEEFSKYLLSVDMKSPMDRLEAFEILNTFLKLDMNLKMDKSRDIKYIQTLLHSCNELIRKKTVSFPPGSPKNQLITQKAVEMIFHLTYFAERSLRGLLKTQKKQIVFKSSPNVAMHLCRGKLSGQLMMMNLSTDHHDKETSYLNLENTLERSAYALIWIKGLREILSTNKYLVNSDVGVATIVSPLNSLNHMLHPPTFDIGLKMGKKIPEGYELKCGQLWNMSHLWNTKDCSKVAMKGDIVTCRCHHLGSISLLLEDRPNNKRLVSASPVGTMISISCITSLCLIVLTFIVNFLLKRGEHNLSVFILINILVCMGAIQLFFLFGVNSTAHFEICMSIALFLHYLFLVLSFWVVSYGVYLLHRLRTAAEYTGSFRDYCAVCWIFPLILLIVSFIGNPQGYEARLYCWLNVQRGILWSFVLPVTGLILVNTIVMILSLKTFNEQMSVTHRTEICRIRNSLRAGITLLPVFAINWFFGLLAVEDSQNVGLQIIFSLTNSIQGIMTFIFFCIMDNNIQLTFRLKLAVVNKKPKVCAMKLKKSGSFPIFERSLISLPDDGRRNDCTPLLASRMAYHDTSEDPCCSNIRV